MTLRADTSSEDSARKVAEECSDTASIMSYPFLGDEHLSDMETCASNGASPSDSEASEEPPVCRSFVRQQTTPRCCKQCCSPYSGFGDTCSACRKAGPRGSITQCTLCSSFFIGVSGSCQDCCL